MSKLIGNYKSALFNVILLLFAISLFIGCQKEESKLDSHINSEESLNTGSPTRSLTLKDSLYVVKLFNSFKKECASAKQAEQVDKKVDREIKKLSNEQYRLFMHMVIQANERLVKRKRLSGYQSSEFEGKAKQALDTHIDNSIELFGVAPHLLSNEKKQELSKYEMKKKE